MYRDFKYSSNQKIIMKIKENRQIKKTKSKREGSRDSSEDSVMKECGLRTLDGELNTRYIKSYMLRENSVFNFQKAVVPRSQHKGKINLENLEERVKEFFGIIDFTKLPVHLLSLEEPIRRKNLKSEVKHLVGELCNYSEDFKKFMKNFNLVLKKSNADAKINFEEIFFREVLKENIIKKVLPKRRKVRKIEKKYYYRKGEKIVLTPAEDQEGKKFFQNFFSKKILKLKI